MTKTARTRVLAGFAALTLAFGATACSGSVKDSVDSAASKAGDAAKDAGDAAKDAAKDAGDAAKDAADKAGDAAKDAAKDAKDAVKDGAEAAKDGADKAGDAAKDAVKDGADAAKDGADKAGDAAKDAADKLKGKKDLVDAAGKDVAVPAAIAAMYEKMGGEHGHLGKLEELKEDGDKYVATFAGGYQIAYSEETGAQHIGGMIAQTWLKEGGLDSKLGLPTASEENRADGNGWVQQFQNGTIEWTEKDGTWGPTVEVK